jgi:subtilisin-like proprotein convertase family protein
MGAAALTSSADAAVGTFASSSAITVVDNQPASPYPATVAVSGLPGTITRITVTLSGVSHTFFEDIDVLLVGPAGQTVLLLSDVGGDNQVSNVTLTFDDAAPGSLSAGPVASGTYRPTNLTDSASAVTPDVFPAPAPAGPFGSTLSVFNGTDPSGTWSLFVRDDSVADSGSFAGGFSLTITTNASTLTVTKAGAGSGTVTSADLLIDCGADCTEVYTAGTVVTLGAEAAGGAVFAGWSGGGCAGTGSCVLTVTGDTAVTATFNLSPPPPPPPEQVTLTVVRTGSGSGSVSGPGIDCGADCTEVFGSSTVVILTATPAPGSVFAGWASGGCGGTGACTAALTADTTVTAIFSLRPSGTAALTVTNGEPCLGRVTSIPAGLACGVDCVETFPTGTTVTLTATAHGGSTFGGWSGGGCADGGACTVTLTADTVVTATFSPPTDRPLVCPPADGTVIPVGATATFAWTTLPGATQYGFEFTGPNLAFTNPNATAPDPVNGFGGAGGGFLWPDTGFSVVIPPAVAPGSYQVRVIAVSDELRLVGRFSDAVTISLVSAPVRPIITQPATGLRLRAGDTITLIWTSVEGVTQYGLEVTGPNREFANPNGTGPDLVNGFGGAGGGVVVAGTEVSAVLPAEVPPGAYQVRVIAIAPTGQLLGTFSDAVTVVVE